jgi:hypothetical protein
MGLDFTTNTILSSDRDTKGEYEMGVLILSQKFLNIWSANTCYRNTINLVPNNKLNLFIVIKMLPT